MNEVEFVCPHCQKSYPYTSLIGGESCPECKKNVKLSSDAVRKLLQIEYDEFLKDMAEKDVTTNEDKEKLVEYLDRAEKLSKEGYCDAVQEN